MGIIRARDEEQKLARKQSLMDSGWALFIKNEDQLPSVAQIVKRAGLAKGTFYLYFKTKEELFIELLSDAVIRLFDNLKSELSQSDIDLDLLIDIFVKYVCEDQILIKLGAIFAGVLEQNTEQDVILRFKMQMVKLLLETGEMIALRVKEKNAKEICYREINADQGAKLLIRSYAVFLGVAQMQPSSIIATEILELPAFAPIRLELEGDTKAILRALWMDAIGSTNG